MAGLDTELRYIQGVLAEEFRKKQLDTVEQAAALDPTSRAAANYEGYWYGLAEADRIAAEVINRYARDGRTVR